MVTETARLWARPMTRHCRPRSLPARRRRRRHGRWGGLAVKRKRFLWLHWESQHAEGLYGKHFIHWWNQCTDGLNNAVHSSRFLRGGVCTGHLCLLPYFIINYLLLITWIVSFWLRLGSLLRISAPFLNCFRQTICFFNSPRTTGRSGGLASIYKDMFSCCPVALNEYNSFEQQLFALELFEEPSFGCTE